MRRFQKHHRVLDLLDDARAFFSRTPNCNRLIFACHRARLIPPAAAPTRATRTSCHAQQHAFIALRSLQPGQHSLIAYAAAAARACSAALDCAHAAVHALDCALSLSLTVTHPRFPVQPLSPPPPPQPSLPPSPQPSPLLLCHAQSGLLLVAQTPVACNTARCWPPSSTSPV
jgi:hypothetical protein